MTATWFDGPADAFVAASRIAWERGLNVTHFLGGSAIEISGKRAIVHTRVSITQRTIFQGQQIDVNCTGRFVDMFSNPNGACKIDRRQACYENDRIAPVVPGPPFDFDDGLLGSFPIGYRHLGYIQTLAGLTVRRDLPGRQGPTYDELMSRCQDWLERASRQA